MDMRSVARLICPYGELRGGE
jgi:hypothetical protein